jgi:hypothetical protein
MAGFAEDLLAPMFIDGVVPDQLDPSLGAR